MWHLVLGTQRGLDDPGAASQGSAPYEALRVQLVGPGRWLSLVGLVLADTPGELGSGRELLG